MPRSLKIALVVLGVFVAVCLGAGYASKVYLGRARDDLMAQNRQMRVEGEAFGRGRPSADCLAESHRRNGACDGLMCEARSGLFMQYCLGASARAPDLCADVPPRREIMRSARWAIARCEADGRPGDARCQRLMQRLQDHCHPPRPR